MNFTAVLCCHTHVYFLFRGSSYEKSWETLYYTFCALRRYSRWLLKPAAAPTCGATTAT